MERPTRRTAANGASQSAATASSTTSRRRRREAERESGGAASDGAETDSSVKAKRPAKASRGAKAELGEEQDSEDPTHEAEDALLAAANGDDEPPSGYATRARRERSQSVVSTTSDTSSIASEAPEETPEVHGEKLAELEKKKKMVEDGTLAEYCRRVAEFKEERNRLLQSAEWHKNLQLKNTADLYGFEVQRAHNIWQESKDKLKETMLLEADALLAKLKEELEALDKADKLPLHAVPPKKTLVLPRRLLKANRDNHDESSLRDSDEQPEGEEDALAPAEGDADTPEEPVDKTPRLQKRRKVESPPPASAPMPDNVVRLPFDDITSDLASIMQERETASAKIHAALPSAQIDLRVDRRRLLCGKYVFEEGDEVVVTAAVLKEDYIGVISSVSDEELFIKLSTGQKVRVAVDHIAYRRCEIRPFLRGSAGIESLQSSGWVECEPF